ncbi:SCAN domain-containing protein 3-like [Mytilus edulis]|uniref:SCAN domain-containing protein 3-like n=1 Tax=Mytilus edulis TaxID=6550 RepID=UPI0039EDF4D6
MEFIKGCVQCACKKPQRNVAPLTPITSKYCMHRGQLDLVDKRADLDGQYCWIGHYIDHYTKFNFFWPQMNKFPDEVAHNLSVHVFSVVGLPSILQHDNGRQFCNAVIRETLKLWPGDGDVKIITGRPRHPRTQGLVEQVHDSLHKLLASKRADKHGSGWLEFLYEIQCSLNTQCHFIPMEKKYCNTLIF